MTKIPGFGAMADLFEADFGTASYRSKDPIKNFKICVRLERVTSASIVPQAQLEQSATNEVELQKLQKQNFGGQKDVEEYTFHWQQKTFCQREVDWYCKDENCTTSLETLYNQDCKRLKQAGRPTRRLFTYVDHDSFSNKDENIVRMTSSPNETQTVLAEKMSNLRHRRGAPNRFKDGYNVSNLPTVNLVDYEPSEEVQRQNHLLSTPVQTMYIMADLAPPGRPPTEEDEFVLCTIQADANGVITIRPDFNKRRKSYRVESAGMGRDVFEYSLEHASVRLTRQEQDKEAKMIHELYSKHVEYLSSLVGHEMELPPVDALRVLVYGEIVSAQNFEYDDLFIHYFWELPQQLLKFAQNASLKPWNTNIVEVLQLTYSCMAFGSRVFSSWQTRDFQKSYTRIHEYWHPGGTQAMAGVTQTCRTVTVGRDNVAYFSFPFQFEVLYRKDIVDDKSEEVIPGWPQLFMEVQSLDSWDRHRTEGYGYTSLPAAPGIVTQTLNCWRPVGRSCLSEVRRFFIGGSPELEDPTYTAVPSTFQGNRVSKFAFRTVSTGSVTVKFNIIQQSQAFLRSATSRKKVGSVLDRLGHSRSQANIMNVLEAFQRAKQRMVAARENLKTDYLETLRAAEPLDDDDD